MTSEIKNCAIQECFYNDNELCHANAITVGADHPMCDTFIKMQDWHGQPADMGHVGACHEFDCKFNETLSCSAPSINVDYHEKHADCVTFEPRPNAEKEAMEMGYVGANIERQKNPRAIEVVNE